MTAMASSPSQKPLSRNTTIALGVVALHVGALWALQSGLLRRAVEAVVPAEILVELIEPAKPIVTPPPPAPPVKRPQLQPPQPQPSCTLLLIDLITSGAMSCCRGSSERVLIKDITKTLERV